MLGEDVRDLGSEMKRTQGSASTSCASIAVWALMFTEALSYASSFGSTANSVLSMRLK
jgi:hypothetical protein